MPRVSDFTIIQGDTSKRIGDGASLWEKNFLTGGSEGNGFLMFMVKGLTETTSTVDVKINNQSVGQIFNYKGADRNHWYTQIVNIGGGILKKNGSNELQLEAVGYPNSPGGNEVYDDFFIRDVICYFQQAA